MTVRRVIAGLAAVLLLAPILYDAVAYRVGPRSTLCRRTSHSSPTFWGDAEVGEEVDLTRSSDYTCGPCDETFHRYPRLVLRDVDSAPDLVEPCRSEGA